MTLSPCMAELQFTVNVIAGGQYGAPGYGGAPPPGQPGAPGYGGAPPPGQPGAPGYGGQPGFGAQPQGYGAPPPQGTVSDINP